MLSVLQQLLLLTYPALYASVALAIPHRASLRFIRIFGVVVHELGHATAALATCTRTYRLQVDPMEGGSVMLHMGERGPVATALQFALIAPAGYVGEGVIGGLILVGSGVPGVDVAVSWASSALLLFAAFTAARVKLLRWDALLLAWWACAGAFASYRPGASSPAGWAHPLLVAAALLAHSLDDVYDDTVRRVHPYSDASLFAREVLGNEKRALGVGKVWWLALYVWHWACLAVLMLLNGLRARHGDDVWDRQAWFVPWWVILAGVILIRIL